MKYIAIVLLLSCAACTAQPSANSFGSPERTAHALQCLPAVMNTAAGAATQASATKGQNTADVLNAINARVNAGEANEIAVACAAYLADLVLDGNAQAKALQQQIGAKAPAATAPTK